MASRPSLAGRCDDGVVLRSVTLGLALLVLATACALVEQPVPPGTIPLQVQVRNDRGPVELTVMTPSGDLPGAVLPGAARPAALAARSTTEVTFHVPPGDWWIAANGSPDIWGGDFSDAIRMGCALGIELTADGGYGYGCLPFR